MRPTERENFGDVMRDAYQAIGQGQPYTEGGLDLMFAAMQDLSMQQIQQALVWHINDPATGKWRPNASMVRDQIEKHTPVMWIAADEAFARITFDDSQPSLLNQVTAAALAVAAPFMEQRRPDHNAARMAFRACYERLAAQEKTNGRAPQYFISGGGSVEAREALQAEAARLGYLTMQGLPFAAPAPVPQLGYSAPPAGALQQLRGFGFKALPLD